MIFRCIRTFSLRYSDKLTSIVPACRGIVQAVQTIQNRRTEISFCWTWFKFGNPSQSNIHNVYNLQIEYVTKFYKVINNLVCNLSFVRQYTLNVTYKRIFLKYKFHFTLVLFFSAYCSKSLLRRDSGIFFRKMSWKKFTQNKKLGTHYIPAKAKCDRQTDRQMDDVQCNPFMALCFVGLPKSTYSYEIRDVTGLCPIKKPQNTNRNFIKAKQQHKNATKSSITQRLRTDLGRSVGVTTATQQLCWLLSLLVQHSYFPQKL